MKTIIIDDEPLALEFLESQLNKLENIEVIGKFTFFDVAPNEELLKSIDLVFLDIEMPELNGIELAKEIKKINPALFVVFVSAYNEYAVKAFELNAVDYLLKPVQFDRLKNTLQRIRIMNPSIDQPAENDRILSISTGKELSFETAGQPENVKWRTAKAKELFLYLLHHQDATIRKDFLAELFWPGFELERAYSQMYTTIYHIRNSLKPFKDKIKIKSKEDSYILLTVNVKVDLPEWEKQLNEMADVNEQTVHQYEKILNSYPGTYLQKENYLWAQAEQFRLEQIWIKAAFRLADYYNETNKLETAISWYNNIIAFHGEEEKAYFELMKIYARTGNRRMVILQYEKLDDLYKELNIPFNNQVAEWFSNWMDEALIKNKAKS